MVKTNYKIVEKFVYEYIGLVSKMIRNSRLESWYERMTIFHTFFVKKEKLTIRVFHLIK